MLLSTHKFIEISCATFEWALTLVIPTPHSYTPSHSSPSYWGDSRLQECRPVPTVPNDCTHKKGFNSLSQLSPHTPACKGRKKKQNSTRLLNPLPLHHLATLNHDPPPSLHCGPYLSPDPGRVHKRPIRSIAGHIYKWKRLNNGAVREKNEKTEGHSQMWRCKGRGEEGAASHCCPRHRHHPALVEGRKKGGLARGEEVKCEVKVTFYTDFDGGAERRKRIKRGRK